MRYKSKKTLVIWWWLAILATLPFVAVVEDAGAISASHYGSGFDGNKTASGDTYHSAGLTAASNLFPLGTVVNVVGPSNENVPVKINDTCGSCGIDLSDSAAEKAGVKEAGRVEVTATPVGASEDAPKPSESLPALPSTGGPGL